MSLHRRERGLLNARRYRGDEGAVVGYQYGAPAGAGGDGSSDDVIIQLVFDEPSGAIESTVDVTDTVAAVGSGQTYGVGATGLFVPLAPGITTLDRDDAFAEDSLGFTAIGTSDFTLELWYKSSDATGSYGLVVTTWTIAGTDSTRFYFSHRATSDVIEMALDNTSTTMAQPVGTHADGVIHKYRVTFDRSGNAEVIFDGSSLGTFSIAAESATSIVSSSLQVGGFQSFASGNETTYYELRISKNLTNNSGGPGGG